MLTVGNWDVLKADTHHFASAGKSSPLHAVATVIGYHHLLCGDYLPSVKGYHHLSVLSYNAEAAVKSGYILLCGDCVPSVKGYHHLLILVTTLRLQ